MNLCIASHADVADTESFIRAQIEGLPANRKLVVCGGFFPKTRGEGARILAIPRTLAGRFKRFYSCEWRKTPIRALAEDALAKLLRAEQIDVVLAQYGPTGVELMNLCERCCIPLVVHFHGHDAHRKETLDRYGGSYATLGQMASRIVVVSVKMKASLLALGVPEEKLVLIPYGVEVERTQAVRAGANPPVFIAVGRFVEKKAPQLTVAAFAGVHRRIPEAKLVMIGEGPLREATRQLAVGMGVGDSVEFRGRCEHGAVIQAMRGARAFVQHSVEPLWGTAAGDSEGLPLAVLEAGACGLPVVATKHAGIPEAVLNGETGFLVEEGDVNGMSMWMTRLAADSDLATRIGLNARERVARLYGIDRYLSKLALTLQEAITE